MDTPDRLEVRTDEGNPLREEQRESVRAELEARLRRRDVYVSGQESDEEIVRMLDAVENFERAVSAAGGDLMVDNPESSQPEHRRYVLPLRRPDDSPEQYIERVDAAAEQVGRAD